MNKLMKTIMKEGRGRGQRWTLIDVGLTLKEWEALTYPELMALPIVKKLCLSPQGGMDKDRVELGVGFALIHHVNLDCVDIGFDDGTQMGLGSESSDNIDPAKAREIIMFLMKQYSDEERLRIFASIKANYCSDCGVDHSQRQLQCQCWNDI